MDGWMDGWMNEWYDKPSSYFNGAQNSFVEVYSGTFPFLAMFFFFNMLSNNNFTATGNLSFQYPNSFSVIMFLNALTSSVTRKFMLPLF